MCNGMLDFYTASWATVNIYCNECHVLVFVTPCSHVTGSCTAVGCHQELMFTLCALMSQNIVQLSDMNCQHLLPQDIVCLHSRCISEWFSQPPTRWPPRSFVRTPKGSPHFWSSEPFFCYRSMLPVPVHRCQFTSQALKNNWLAGNYIKDTTKAGRVGDTQHSQT